MKTLIILPTYNEFHNLEKIIGRILDLQNGVDVLVVDDNSCDGTQQIAQVLCKTYKGRVFLIERSGKAGLGLAYIEGFKFALEYGYDYIFEVDDDFSHDPAEIPNFLRCTGEADVLIGSRYIEGIRIMNWPLNRLILSYVANIYARGMTGLRLSDCTSGYKCFSRKVLQALPLDSIFSNGYAFQIEVNYLCKKLGFTLKEVPIVFTERKFGSSKMSREIIHESIFLGIKILLKRALKR